MKLTIKKFIMLSLTVCIILGVGKPALAFQLFYGLTHSLGHPLGGTAGAQAAYNDFLSLLCNHDSQNLTFEIIYDEWGTEVNEEGDMVFNVGGQVINGHVASQAYVNGIPRDSFSITFDESIAAFGVFAELWYPSDQIDEIFLQMEGGGSQALPIPTGGGSGYWGATFFSGAIVESPGELFREVNFGWTEADIGPIIIARYQDLYTPIPIPGAVWLFGSGLIGLLGLRRKLIA